MRLTTYILKSMRYRWRLHAGTSLGVALGCAIVVGSLVVGDSVRQSLAQVAHQRLGQVAYAVATGNRYFTVELAQRLNDSLTNGHPAVAVLQGRGVVERPDSDARANQVDVLGVDDAFWKLALKPVDEPPSVAVNQALAERLGVKPGDTLVIRVELPSYLSRDAALTPATQTTGTLRVTLDAVLTPAQLGNFALAANQLAPLNVFVKREVLARELERPGKANLLLLPRVWQSAPEVEAALRENLSLADAQLEVRQLARQGVVELRTPEVFLTDSIVQAATQEPKSRKVLTYFVNSIRREPRATPYSMVAALETSDLADNEIVLNKWCADDLQAKPGDTVTLQYWVEGPDQKLEERQRAFSLKRVIPDDDPLIDSAMMPPFPGLSDVSNCRDWDSGIPIQLNRIRDKDEKYWEQFKGLPKAVVTLTAGRQMWSNRFGSTTAVRLPIELGAETKLRNAIVDKVGPSGLGFSVRPVAELADRAYRQGLDFSGLFLGFSSFLVMAALLLVGLLAGFSVKRRRRELGALLALGFRRRTVYALLLAESAIVAVPGLVVGSLLGIAYAALTLRGLLSVWQGAIGDWPVRLHAGAGAVLGGAVGGAVMVLAVIAVTFWRTSRAPIADLLRGAGQSQPVKPGRQRRFMPMLKWFCLGGAVAVGGGSLFLSPAEQSLGWFGLGALLLAGGLAVLNDLLHKLGRWHDPARLTLWTLGVRNLTRRRGRSVAVAAMLASGTFLLIALETQRLSGEYQPSDYHSPAGGFDLVAQTTHPIFERLDTQHGRDALGVPLPASVPLEVLPFRVLGGDDMSCLNLNRAQRPRLLAGDTLALAKRDPFTFMAHLPVGKGESPWTLLAAPAAPDEVPAIGDFNAIVYTLGKQVGDTLDYVDETGHPFKIRIVGALANAVIRSGFVVDEQLMLRRFPSQAGHSYFLIDTPTGEQQTVATALNDSLADYGLDARPASAVLAEYDRVQNTYLSIFQILGGLGLILGSVGLGLLVANHVLERQGELALMRALGFPVEALHRLIVGEHVALFAGGLVTGTLAAVVSIIPQWLRPGAQMPLGSLALILVVLLGSGVAWTWLAAWLAGRSRLLPALRRE